MYSPGHETNLGDETDLLRLDIVKLDIALRAPTGKVHVTYCTVGGDPCPTYTGWPGCGGTPSKWSDPCDECI